MKHIICIITMMVVFTLSAPATALADGQIITVEETWSIDLDQLYQRIDRILSSEFFEEDPEFAAGLKAIINLLDLAAFETYGGEFYMKDGKIHYGEELRLKEGSNPAYLSRLLFVPDQKINLGRIVDTKQALLTVGIASPIEKLEVLWNMLNDTQIQAEVSKFVPGGEVEMLGNELAGPAMFLESLGGFSRLKGIIGDEVHIAMFDMPADWAEAADFNPMNLTALVALEIDDMDGFDELSGGFITQIKEAGTAMTLGKLDFYNLMESVMLGLGDGYIVVALNPANITELFAAPGDPGSPLVCSGNIQININNIWHDYLAPLMNSEDMPYEARNMLDLAEAFCGIKADTDFGALGITCSSDSGVFAANVDGESTLMDLYGLLVFSTAIPNYIGLHDKALAAETKANMHAIQLAVERFAFDSRDGFYPDDLQVLFDEGYLVEYPGNPFNDFQPMRQVQEGEYSAGDFIYIPWYNDEGNVYGYALKGFGGDEFGGMEGSGVIIKLTSGPRVNGP